MTNSKEKERKEDTVQNTIMTYSQDTAITNHNHM